MCVFDSWSICNYNYAYYYILTWFLSFDMFWPPFPIIEPATCYEIHYRY